ncbi:LysR family transcriptional regulator [Cryobacterium sp. PH31-O1]|uniref:LysR family transcriptional regulator n=1 Tax=Cryobacterium sp. PH31-O1 TaxID=3046306 RepID=UPI0024B91F33|nr:LysR family transcriptional regulator [Cryobacterium sp. PH31-O1]MDJ0337871.1 LysR family transcriptional regulator [Cryobacterium sp. PH31-O1]
MLKIDGSSITLRQLSVFVAVIDESGFGAAADLLHMSQSAVSHALAAMERSLGLPLIIRGPQIAATPLGEAVLQHARSVLASLRALQAAADLHVNGAATGTVRLAAAPTASHRLVPALLQRWRAELPGLDIRLFEGGDDELELWLTSGIVDAAILIDPDPIPEGSVVLARDDFRAVLRADHPLAGLERVTLASLQDDPFLSSSSGSEPKIATLHKMAGVPYRPAQRVHECSTLIGMVEAELGVAILPSLARSMLTEGVVMIELDPSLERTLVFSGPRDRPWHPSVERMRDIAAAGAIHF